MEILIATSIAVLTGGGIFLLLKARTFTIILGLMMFSYAVNLFLFSMGRLRLNEPAILLDRAKSFTDPLPQALVLTAIVISFGMTAFIIVLSLRAKFELGSDHVDGAIKGEKQ